MKKAIGALKRILRPPFSVLAVLSILLLGILLVYFLYWRIPALAYLIYGRSGYLFFVFCFSLPSLIRKRKQAYKRIRMGTKAGRRYLTDSSFHNEVRIRISRAIDLAYVLFRLTTGILYLSPFFISVAAYHFRLGFIRLNLFRSSKKQNDRIELHAYRNTACSIYLLSIPRTARTLLLSKSEPNRTIPPYTLYLTALYAFYSVIASAIRLLKKNKEKSPIRSSALVLKFVAALWSIFSLQVNRLSVFSDDEQSLSYRNSITGPIINLSVILIAYYRLRNSEKKKEEANRLEPLRK